MDEDNGREQYCVRCLGCRAVSARSGVPPQRLARRRRSAVLEATCLPAGRGRSPVYTRLDRGTTGAAIDFERDLAA